MQFVNWPEEDYQEAFDTPTNGSVEVVAHYGDDNTHMMYYVRQWGFDGVPEARTPDEIEFV